MDFSMYSMLTKSDAAHTLPERMKGELMFSKDELNDTWLSDMLCNRMTQAQSLDFRKRWIAHCKESGVTSAWISIDGSNNDCAAKACSLTEPGKAKSHTDSDIISHMYAVNAQTGMPITYMVSNGGKVDAKAFKKMYAFLGLHGIEAKGVLLDRAFCTPDIFRMLEEAGIPYVIMLKSDTYAHVRMYETSAEELRWNVRHIVNEDSLFGMASGEKCRIFGSKDTEAYLIKDGRTMLRLKKNRTLVLSLLTVFLNDAVGSVEAQLSRLAQVADALGKAIGVDMYQSAVVPGLGEVTVEFDGP